MRAAHPRRFCVICAVVIFVYGTLSDAPKALASLCGEAFRTRFKKIRMTACPHFVLLDICSSYVF